MLVNGTTRGESAFGNFAPLAGLRGRRSSSTAALSMLLNVSNTIRADEAASGNARTHSSTLGRRRVASGRGPRLDVCRAQGPAPVPPLDRDEAVDLAVAAILGPNQ